MRTWQVERRKRTRHLIELGGLVVKAGIVNLTGDDRAMIYGALLWMADKLRSAQGEHARGVWTKLGRMAFEAEGKGEKLTASQVRRDRGGRPEDLKYRCAARHRVACCLFRNKRCGSRSRCKARQSRP